MSNLFSWFNKKGSGKTPDRAAAAALEAEQAAAEGDVKLSTKLYEEAAGIYKSLGMRREEALIYHSLAQMLVSDSGYTAAFEAFDTSIAILKELSLRSDLAVVLRDCGIASAAYSNTEQAESYLRESMVLFEALGDTAGRCSCIEGLGSMAYQAEDYSSAITYYEQAVQSHSQAGDNTQAAICCLYLSSSAVAMANFEEAAKRFNEGMTYFRAGDSNVELLSLIAELAVHPFEVQSESQINELLNASFTIFAASGDDQGAQSAPIAMAPDSSAANSGKLGVPGGARANSQTWQVFASANVVLAGAAYHQDNAELARRLFETAVSLAKSNDDLLSERSIRYQAGVTALHHLDLDTAVLQFRAVAENSDSDETYRALALDGCARTLLIKRDISGALADCESSLELFKASASIKNVARSLALYGLLLAESGDISTGTNILKESLILSKKSEDPNAGFSALTNLGIVATGQDDAFARSCLKECLNSDQIDGRLRSTATVAMGELELAKGELAASYELGCSALSLGIEEADFRNIPDSLELCAHIATEWGDIETAVLMLSASEMIRQKHGAVRRPDRQVRYENDLSALQADLGATEFQTAWDEGAELQLSELLTEANALLDEIEPDTEVDDMEQFEDSGAIV